MSTSHHRPSAVATLYAGLALTVGVVILAFVDHATGNVLADHIRHGYPTYSQSRIDTAVTTYLVILSALGALGAAGWLGTIRAVRAGKRWAGAVATALFAVGAAVSLFALLVRDTSGDTGLPALLGWAGMLPSLVGLVAVVLPWRRP
jgi:hypothetical protein